MNYSSGFTHSDVYSMPVYLRNFYYKMLVKAKKEEKEQYDKASGKSNSQSKPPSYSYAKQ